MISPLAPAAAYSLRRQGVWVTQLDVGAWAIEARARADRMPEYNGDAENLGWIIARCRWYLPAYGALCALTRDAGMHTSGWWKNPDYERCWHLSVSFRDNQTGTPLPKDADASDEICRAVYGTNIRKLWCEPPYGEQGKKLDVWHYRLFMAPDWLTPIVPRGEVYSREFIPKNWKSWSDAQADRAVPNQGGIIT